MKYAQIKPGQKLHLVFSSEGYVSNPLCGIKATSYRMTINVPLGHACKNCQRVHSLNGGKRVKNSFLESLKI